METMEIDRNAGDVCEHGYERGACSTCDDASAEVYEPVQRLRDYLAAHPELDDDAGLLQGVPLS
jgi:hypothetical protein